MSLETTISARLDKARPPRYLDGESSWVEEVADSIDLTIEETEESIRAYKRAVARRIEGNATKSGNNMMRMFYRTGQLPLDWATFTTKPISLENTVIESGEAKRVKERVQLGHATARDFTLWAETEQRNRQRDYDARGDAIKGAERIAFEMQSSNAMTFSEWAQRHAPIEESAA